MLLQCAKRYDLFTVPARYTSHFLNNYALEGSMVLQKEAYENMLKRSQLMYGTTCVAWKGAGHRLSKGDTIVVHLEGGWIMLTALGQRRAIVQEGSVAQAANN